MGTVIKMYGAVSGGAQPALAQIDVPAPGNIVGVEWAIRAVLATDFFVDAQLSFRSAASLATNDDRGIISEARLFYEITTTGSGQIHVNKYVQIPEVPVMGGERLYLHTDATAAVTGNVAVLVHFSFDLDKISMRRR